jgi:hypothetical protein
VPFALAENRSLLFFPSIKLDIIHKSRFIIVGVRDFSSYAPYNSIRVEIVYSDTDTTVKGTLTMGCRQNKLAG